MNQLTRTAMAALCLAVVAAPVSATRIEVIGPNGLLTSEQRPVSSDRFIVEFVGNPSVLGGTEQRALSDTFERFRRDIAPVAVKTSDDSKAKPQIHREFTATFFGAAVQIAPSDVARLRRLPYVRAIHRDMPVNAYQTPQVVDARPRVNATSLPARGAGITVAVIDTGIDYMHPALGGGFGPGFKVAGGYDFANNDADPMDDAGHGTHVAGTVAANSATLIGVAPDATLLAYKVLNAQGNGLSSDIIAAIERSVDPNQDGNSSDRVDVINLSLGGAGTADDATSRAANNAVAAGVVVCVAAGNAGEIGSIGSPGTAVDVITVGAVDDTGAIAGFSSRGPSPRLLGFKPEVMAPGVGIVSAMVGGGTVPANGTSMATPHVAGLAALLRELHPDWSPATLKSALVTTTNTVSAHPYARGAGRVDGVRANQASILLSESGLSFGLHPLKTERTEVRRSITLTNRSTSAQQFTISAAPPASGITISATPSTVQLPAGQVRSIEVLLTIDNSVAAFPSDSIVGGDLRFTGSSSFIVPWAFIRGARATVTHDGVALDVMAFGPGGPRRPFRYDANAAEIFISPSAAWDFVVAAYDQYEEGARPSTVRLAVAERVPVSGDDTIALPQTSAALNVVLDGRDATGTRIAELPERRGERERTITLRLNLLDEYTDFGYAFHLEGIRDILVSPLSSRYTLIAEDSYIDLQNMRGYAIQYAPQSGVDTPLALQNTSLVHARLQFPRGSGVFKVCNAGADTRRGQIWTSGDCLERTVSSDVLLDFYASSQTTPQSYVGMTFDNGMLLTPTMRGHDGAVIASSDAIPAVTTPRLSHDAEATFGAGPLFPYAYFGTTAGQPQLFAPVSAFTGAYGESMYEQGSSRWTMYDAAGVVTSAGTIGGSANSLPPSGTAASRLAVLREGGDTLDVRFGNDATDLMAPTITSLRVVDAAGLTTNRLAVNDSATLQFSAADLDYARGLSTQPTRPEATAVSWRIAGTSEWRPLAVQVIGAETGSRGLLRHVPAGDIYRADLSPATRLAGSTVELRIEIVDTADNRVEWTSAPAFVIEEAGAAGPRRRGVRR